MATSRLTGLYVSILEEEPKDERVTQAKLEVAADATAIPNYARTGAVIGSVLLTAVTQRDASQVKMEVAGAATALPPAMVSTGAVVGMALISEPANEQVSRAALEVSARFFQTAQMYGASLEVAAEVLLEIPVQRAALEVVADSTIIKPKNTRRVVWWTSI